MKRADVAELREEYQSETSLPPAATTSGVLFYRAASEEHSCVETASQEPTAIYFTSGTTGSPKMALHSHSSLGIGFTIAGR